MTGANNDVVNKLAEEFNASQKDYKVVASYKGQYADNTERRHRRLPRRQRSPHPAGLRSRHRDHDGRQGRHQAGPRDDEGSGREVRSAGLPAGHHRLLLDRQGRDALLPVQLLLDGHVDQQGRAEEGRHRRDPEDLAAGVRSRQEAEGRRPRAPAASRMPGLPGPTSSSSRPGTTFRWPPRPTASTASTRR